jgi:Domain of unknown function (DUF4395)
MSDTRTALVDPRGLRVAAALTALVLGAVLLTGNPLLLAAQTLVFAVGAIGGVRRSPYSLLFARVVRPRLAPPAEMEAPEPPRFAQGVGLAFSVVALAGFWSGAPAVGLIATTMAFIAALLNATTGFCLGCEVYLLLRRIGIRSTSTDVIPPSSTDPVPTDPAITDPARAHVGTPEEASA